ncbi:TetR/AcrR family transcriptional regulator [Actinomadura sp. DC4]|uniref:TetR/AcrR family transcriptional regulator n=1 Tax=Actinomadura sp. DC4 TaxID=3055069 RepID=UPI0025B17FDC|nr:TetR/AcrR family transcriptional regulator [Actinomadura sp. DC4]MDN3354350.1 TetR/AcrR family transcriptional regulator [Actinomadura sp. DC4]
MREEGSLRERLIDVGAELVATEGTAALGLREIARRAGVSHGAPRRYFPTYHALLSAIARRGFDDLGARFAGAIAGVTAPRDRLRALAGAYVAYALERRGMFELMFRHDLLDSERQDASDGPRLRESTLPLFEGIVGLVAQCRPGEPEVTAAVLWSNLHGVAQLWTWRSLQLVLSGGAADVGRLVDAVLDAHLGPANP